MPNLLTWAVAEWPSLSFDGCEAPKRVCVFPVQTGIFDLFLALGSEVFELRGRVKIADSLGNWRKDSALSSKKVLAT